MVQDVEPRVVDPRHHVGVGEPLQLISIERQHHSQPVGRLLRIRHRIAERVPGVVVGVRRFDVGDDGRAERRLAGAHRLQRDVVAVEYRGRFLPAETICGAVDVERRAVDVERPAVECDAAGLDRLDVAHPYHVLDLPQRFEFGLGQDRAPVHRRVDGGVDTQQATLGFQPVEQILERFGLVHRRELAGEVGEGPLGELPTGLDRGAIQDPGVAGLDPRQPLRRDAVTQQPQAGVHRRLACADNHVAIPASRIRGRSLGGTQSTPGATA